MGQERFKHKEKNCLYLCKSKQIKSDTDLKLWQANYFLHYFSHISCKLCTFISSQYHPSSQLTPKITFNQVPHNFSSTINYPSSACILWHDQTSALILDHVFHEWKNQLSRTLHQTNYQTHTHVQKSSKYHKITYTSSYQDK